MSKRVELLLHIAIWLILILSPLTFLNHGDGVSATQFIMTTVAPLTLMIVFYTNYYWLTPHFLISGEKRYYWLFNIVMVIGLGVALHYWMSYTHDLFSSAHHPHRQPTTIDMLIFILRDIFQLTIAAAIATTIQLAMRWQHAEAARKDAEAARVDAELSNLRSQINPHFLLNTLNNIYALTSFDAEKAQDAIQELSKMLRHILYDYQQPTVALQEEMAFLQNYINLMRIRLPKTVEVRTHFSTENAQQQIAPMIFISLIENAFKHGISPTLPSFVDISITADAHLITCCIRNSNHPKTSQDRSGHGIGLEQVRRRLDLAYPGCYTWTKGTLADNTIYQSEIKITIH